MMNKLSFSVAAGVALLVGMQLLAAGCASAQATAPGFKGRSIMEAPISGDETRQASVAWLEFAPGGTNARHTHPGDCYATVIEGSIELRIDGQPARVYKAGEAYNVARGLVHEMQNVGQAPARMVVTFIVDKGKPVRQAAQ